MPTYEPIPFNQIPVWAILLQMEMQGLNPLRKKEWFKVSDILYFCVGDEFYRFELRR